MSNIDPKLTQKYDFVVDFGKTVKVYPKGVERTEDNSLAYLALDKGYAKGTYEDSHVYVDKYAESGELRRKGIATAMYQAAVDNGMRVFRSPDQEYVGEVLWRGMTNKGLANRHGEFVGANPKVIHNDYGAIAAQKAQDYINARMRAMPMPTPRSTPKPE